MQNGLPYFRQLYVAAGVMVAMHQGKQVHHVFFVSPSNNLPYVWEEDEAKNMFLMTRHHSHLYRVYNLPGKPLTFTLVERGSIETPLIRFEGTNQGIQEIFPMETFTIDHGFIEAKTKQEIIAALLLKSERLTKA